LELDCKVLRLNRVDHELVRGFQNEEILGQCEEPEEEAGVHEIGGQRQICVDTREKPCFPSIDPDQRHHSLDIHDIGQNEVLVGIKKVEAVVF